MGAIETGSVFKVTVEIGSVSVTYLIPDRDAGAAEAAAYKRAKADFPGRNVHVRKIVEQ